MPIADLIFLVAEDDELQRRWLAIMLGNLGARQIVEVADGLAALAMLRDASQKIDIAFIDLNMPGMDGMELIHHIARENCRTSIVLASALDGSLLLSLGTMSKAYGIDLLGTIEKPATPAALAELVNLYRPQARLKSTGCAPRTG